MSDLPSPLTPAECNLQDFEFMPVMVRRLLKSDTWSLGTGDERAAAVALWFESWHQVPAASLPSEDRMLKRLADTEKWSKVKVSALRGWVLCSDGRLYHPVVAEKALEAWIEKLLAAISGASGNAKRWGLSINTGVAMGQLQIAIGMLREIAPQSKTFKKKAVVAAAAGIAPGSHPDAKQPPPDSSPPDSPPDSDATSPPESGSDRNRQGQGQREGFSSVPIGTGGEAAKTADQLTKDELWKAGKSLLSESGLPAAQCGSFVGKLVKDYGDAIVIEAVRGAVVARPADPVEYLKATCMHAAGQRANKTAGKHTGFQNLDYRAGVNPDGSFV